MRLRTSSAAALLLLAAALVAGPSALLGRREGGKPPAPAPAAAGKPFGLTARVPWTASRVRGTPEPPPPYKVERAFPKLTFKNPLLMARVPGTKRLAVGEQVGKLYTFPNDPKVAKADLFLDLPASLTSWQKDTKLRGVDAVYGLAFHPQFAKNRYCYVCYVLGSKDGQRLPEGTRVSRFTVPDADPPRADPRSEKVLLTWLAGGHNGGDLHFGPDGMLYISAGDAADPNPPDVYNTGQDISDLLSSVLRIDVDREDKGKGYAVPPDNPFVKTPKARPEVWAFGFRNPWRMSFDRPTGDLWVGDVGWELWEMVYRVRKGGNYGWSIMEGPQPVHPNAPRGPTPILPPNLYFPHTEGASITGGYVYRGKRLPGLAGTYVCGDWVTGTLWGTRFDGDKVKSHQVVGRTNLHIVAFGVDHDDELYFLSYDDKGGLFRLAPNPAAAEKHAPFPRKISETGLFESAPDHRPAPGVVPFSVNAAQWCDGATAERFLALPGDTSTVKLYDRPMPTPGNFYQSRIFFPQDGVLARTVTMETERGNPASRRRLETQVLHFDGSEWHGYTYRWNDAQTDADLVPAAGADQPIVVKDPDAPGGKRKLTWHFPSRNECLTCHNYWANNALAFNTAQLDRDQDYGGVTDNQLRALAHVGLVTPSRAPGDDPNDVGALPTARLVSPHDAAAGVDERARAYLHVNCSHCHQFGAGGTADIELRYDVKLEETKAVAARPMQGTFDLPDGKIVAPGDPFRSVLLYRVSKVGRGRMPHVGSEVVDERGVRLLEEWIRRIPVRKEEREAAALLDKLRALDEPAVLAREREAGDAVKGQAPERARRRAAERTEAVTKLLSTTSTALILARAVAEGRVPASVRGQVVAAAMARPDVQVRDLFERFVPDEQRVARLGNSIKPQELLARKGDAARGRDFFLQSGSLCVSCHKVNGTGGNVGPDLGQIGKKYTKGQILESILEPSKFIDPQYVAYVVETEDGKVLTGLLASKTDKEVVLRDAEGKEVRLPAAKVASLTPSKQSLMPEQLLRDLTAEQAADLLEFLASLK